MHALPDDFDKTLGPNLVTGKVMEEEVVRMTPDVNLDFNDFSITFRLSTFCVFVFSSSKLVIKKNMMI